MAQFEYMAGWYRTVGGSIALSVMLSVSVAEGFDCRQHQLEQDSKTTFHQYLSQPRPNWDSPVSLHEHQIVHPHNGPVRYHEAACPS